MQVLPPSSTGGPSRLFIMRPVATTLLMVAILLAGIIGYRALPVSALPEVDYPTIQVVTLYPGASPDVMTSAVTAPPELCDDICFRPDICPNWRSSGAVTAEVMTSGLAPG